MPWYRYQNLDKPEEFYDVHIREDAFVPLERKSVCFESPSLAEMQGDLSLKPINVQEFVSHRLVGRLD
jgi:hypothetical protein